MNPATFAELAEALRAGTAGLYAEEAAADLITAHGTWLHRPDFTAAAVERVTTYAGTPAAFINWDAALAADLPCATSEYRILRLAGHPTPEPLAELLSSLDEHNVALVLDAIAHTAGWHARHLTHTVTGHLGGPR
jgi:hypothetical protein